MASPVAVILQSSYIPWLGYFDLIAASDVFVLFDDVQFTKRDWRNRNRIKTAAGPAWLTIPVVTKGRFNQPIDRVEIADASWAEAHWRRISHAYARAPHFAEFAPVIEELYRRAAALDRLSAVNRLFLEGLCDILSITPNFIDARMLSARGVKSDRLLDICARLGAASYLSGPSARAYLEPAKFKGAGVALHYMDYSAYQEYDQLHGAFDPHVSILDLIFMTGASARGHLTFAGRP
ncbi:MAG: WbqC family protein [Parvularculaceae bacterium]